MIGHQREVLSALGIDIWIPRAESCQQQAPSSLWRDQASLEIITELKVPAIEPIKKPVVLPVSIDKTTTSEPAVLVKEISSKQSDTPAEPIQHIAAFSLQTLNLQHCVIVVDVTQLNTAQQELWRNIQHAVEADFAEINWPFAWQAVQDGRGAASYVSGFIDVQGIDKHILCLGAVPYYQHANAIQLASLQEMLEQPLLKRRLWQLIQNKI
jgi:DNA polymerase III psi subunit